MLSCIAVSRSIVIIGAGIVGTAVAEQLSLSGDCSVTVVDRAGAGRLPGSTGHAPGFVGMIADHPIMIELARDTIRLYRRLDRGGRSAFRSTGAVEIAWTAEGCRGLLRRLEQANSADIPARLCAPDEAARLAPRMVDGARARLGLHLPLDGAADATYITAELRARARAAGARFVANADVTGIRTHGDRITGVHTPTETFPADDVVIAGGIWGPRISALAGVRLPLVPVVHPYVYASAHTGTHRAAPLVRWPDLGSYARDHGDRDGLGTSGHDPVPAPDLTWTAEVPWSSTPLDQAIAAALQAFPDAHRWSPERRFAGVLSITPDKMPLVGRVGPDGLWVAEAIWVTHAAGAARVLAAMMHDEQGLKAVTSALDPARFAHLTAEDCAAAALGRYRTGVASRPSI
ncbi:FAD-dependent oxidoreductase [Plantactinospora sp. B6F1]|uniref:NAD(P)/FAD-dependent oxidoreductase n=1 Tax=Plantactinospora sp. B6F1 TaxID=3158971 RepID=UPI0032D93F45